MNTLSPDQHAALIRGLALGVPLLACTLAWAAHPPAGRRLGGVIAATLWVLVTLYPVQLVAMHLGWWRFEAEGGTLRSFPVDLWLGWALLWGTLPALLSPRLPMHLVVAVALLIDAAFMPLGAPVVQLGADWLWGEAVALAACLVPAQYLARWMQLRRRLAGRCLLQSLAVGLTVVWVLPDAVLANTGGQWGDWQQRPWGINLALVLVLAAATGFGLWAVVEFAMRGGGTPFPYDPPVRLVTTGPYALLRSPMQAAALVFVLAWGALLGSAWVALGLGGSVLFYNLGFARAHEDLELTRRYGDAWLAYRRRMDARWFAWTTTP